MLMKKIAHIYSLNDPFSGQPKYIGLTKDLHRRFLCHIRCDKDSYKTRWILGLKKHGLLPIMEVIDSVDYSDAAFWEMHYMSLYKSWGFKLTNLTRGGEGTLGYKYSKEQIKKAIETKKRTGVDKIAQAKIRDVNVKNGVYDRARERMLGPLNPGKKQCIPILQYSFDGFFIAEYESAKAASVATGFDRANISRASRGVIKSSNGFVWLRKGDVVEFKIPAVKIKHLKKRN